MRVLRQVPAEPIGPPGDSSFGRWRRRDMGMAVEAIWNEQVIAHSDRTVVVEGNHYFPREDIDMSTLEKSATTTVCPWKGTAHYYSIEIEGGRNVDAAWYYPDPKPKAEQVRDRIAFWKGVEVIEA
jgi:uncharacterized protein (DUF427 family)